MWSVNDKFGTTQPNQSPDMEIVSFVTVITSQVAISICSISAILINILSHCIHTNHFHSALLQLNYTFSTCRLQHIIHTVLQSMIYPTLLKHHEASVCTKLNLSVQSKLPLAAHLRLACRGHRFEAVSRYCQLEAGFRHLRTQHTWRCACVGSSEAHHQKLHSISSW